MQALELAMADLVLGRAIPPSDRAAVDAWLARHGVSERDADAVRSEVERLAVYRSLVRNRLRDTVELAIPRTMARLGSLFEEWFDRFLAERGPRTHYLRDVTTEFLDFMTPLAEDDERVPPWALDLARHEALDIVVGSLPETPPLGVTPELDPDRGLEFSATARIVRYRFAVHRLSADLGDRSEPERVPTALFVHRSPESPSGDFATSHDVRYLELTPLAACILERLLDGATLREALERGARELGVTLDGAVLDGTARVLANLSERGAVTGVRSAKSAPADLPNARDPAENTVPPAPGARPRTE
jgi:hypothetical protein